MRRLFFWLLLLAVFAGGFAYTMYNKPHKDYATEEVAKSWSADELVAWYTSHPAVDHAQWQEKVVAVTGEVTSADDRGVILAPGVVVTWETGAAPDAAPSGQVSVKGRVVGFDDLFGEVRLDHARLAP